MPSMMRDLRDLNHYRIKGADSLHPDYAPRFEGAFEIRSPVVGTLRVIASADAGWDHVSVSAPRRAPVWAEMEYVKRMFFFDKAACYQLHVPVAAHLSIHPHVLHIWRPWDEPIPLPPAIMV